MHGADNPPNPSGSAKKPSAATGAARAVHTKTVMKEAQLRTSINEGAKVKAGKINEIRKPDEAPAGCTSWWSF